MIESKDRGGAATGDLNSGSNSAHKDGNLTRTGSPTRGPVLMTIGSHSNPLEFQEVVGKNVESIPTVASNLISQCKSDDDEDIHNSASSRLETEGPIMNKVGNEDIYHQEKELDIINNVDSLTQEVQTYTSQTNITMQNTSKQENGESNGSSSYSKSASANKIHKSISPPNSVSVFPDEISPQTVNNFPIGVNDNPLEFGNVDIIDLKVNGTSNIPEVGVGDNNGHVKMKILEGGRQNDVDQNFTIDTIRKECTISTTTNSEVALDETNPSFETSYQEHLGGNGLVVETTTKFGIDKLDRNLENEPKEKAVVDEKLSASDSSINEEYPSISRDHDTQSSKVVGNGNIRKGTINLDERTAETQRIRIEVTSMDKLKISLYSEALKVHGGKGGDRIFANYWDALGRYLVKGDSLRSNDNTASNGVEAALLSFLSTKRLRKLHNTYVKLIMKQCLHVNGLRNRILNHVPLGWKSCVKQVVKKRDYRGEFKPPIPKSDGIECLMEKFQMNSDAFGNSCSQLIKLMVHETIDENLNKSMIESSRLPGTLEIDHISRYVTEKEGYCLSQSAQWLVVIAVQDYLKRILQRTMDYSDSVGSGAKRRRLSSYQFSKVMENGYLTAGNSIFSANSRIAWEHFTSGSGSTVSSQLHSELNTIKDIINSKFSTKETDRRDFRPNHNTNSTGALDIVNTRFQGNDFSGLQGQQPSMTPPLVNMVGATTQNTISSVRRPVGLDSVGTTSEAVDHLGAEYYNAQNHRPPQAFFRSALETTHEDSASNAGLTTHEIFSAAPLQQNNPLLMRANNPSVYLPQVLAGVGRAAESARTSSAGSNTSLILGRPSSSSSRRPTSASSSNTNSGGGRGRGSKDLSAMLARSKAK